MIKPCLIETIQKHFRQVKVSESNLRYWFKTPIPSITESQRCSQQNVNIFDVGAETSQMIGHRYFCRLTTGKVIFCIVRLYFSFLLFNKWITTFSSPAAFSNLHD